MKDKATVRLIKDREVAYDPHSSSRKLKKLVQHNDVRIRVELAKHNNVTAEILDTLSWDENSDVRAEAAKNILAQESTLYRLFDDPEKYVSFCATINPSATTEIINRAALSNDLYLQNASSQNFNGRISEHSLNVLIKTRDNSILCNIIDNPHVQECYKIQSVISTITAEKTLERINASSDAIERAHDILAENNHQKFVHTIIE